MIFDALVTPLFLIAYAIIALFDLAPAMPPDFISLMLTFHSFLFTGVAVLSEIFGPVFVVTTMSLAILLLAFDQIWYVTIFIIRKLPFIGVR